MDWQPIETAPKDGSLILIRYGDLVPCHARWKYGCWRTVEYKGPSYPTQWMPLPEPPVS